MEILPSQFSPNCLYVWELILFAKIGDISLSFLKRFSRYFGKSVISTDLQTLIVEVDADADISIGSETIIEQLLNKLNPRYSQLSINILKNHCVIHRLYPEMELYFKVKALCQKEVGENE